MVDIKLITEKIVSEIDGGPIEAEYITAVLKLVAGDRDKLYQYNKFEVDVYGGIIYRKMLISGIGEAVKSHKHVYDHFTFIHKGSVDINGEIFHAGQFAKVPAEAIHTIKALTNDCEVYCIHSEYEAEQGELNK